MKNKILIFYILGIAIVTAVAFLPALSNQFVDWDDPAYVTENESVQVLSADNVKKFFTRSYVASYCPLVMLSYAAEYSIFGPNPFVYHLTNYLLNICITLLVFVFIYMLSRNHKVAFITALIFGVHPVHVESVAWIAERKDLLCALFYMIAVTVYLVYLKDKKVKWYLFCFIAAVLALFSKAMAVTIPLVFLLIDYYRGRKIDKVLFLEKIPFFGIALIFGLVNIYFQKLSGATELVASLEVKLYFLSKVILFYLYKILVPLNLSAIYPYHSVDPTHIVQIKYYLAAVLVLIALVAASARWSKKTVFGSAFFLITVLPVLKIIPVGDAFAADRYMYLPSIGLFYIFAVFVNWILKSEFCQRQVRRIGVYVILAVMVVSLTGMTWQRCLIWKDSSTLFSDVVSKYPTASIAYNNLGTFYAEKGEID
ncbi:MAG: glycosyltransferase family 39 protein, partial [Candidatus Tantalella remota]|nr:glycosyltransferase family 39 protein [Candidatus Tantalella remota]